MFSQVFGLTYPTNTVLELGRIYLYNHIGGDPQLVTSPLYRTMPLPPSLPCQFLKNKEQRNSCLLLIFIYLCKVYLYLLCTQVCRRLNEIAAGRLNSTFHQLQNKMLMRFQHIKAQMPRRESARRNHPLARECDIVETLHMRLTLLQMTFGKHIERKHICFFPGEVRSTFLIPP